MPYHYALVETADEQVITVDRTYTSQRTVILRTWQDRHTSSEEGGILADARLTKENLESLIEALVQQHNDFSKDEEFPLATERFLFRLFKKV